MDGGWKNMHKEAFPVHRQKIALRLWQMLAAEDGSPELSPAQLLHHQDKFINQAEKDRIHSSIIPGRVCNPRH